MPYPSESLNLEIVAALEQDTVNGYIKVLEGLIHLSALEGFDYVVERLEEAVEYLRAYPQEDDEDGIHPTSSQ